MIKLECATCGAVLTVPDQFAGKTGRCQNCGATIPIPGGPEKPKAVEPSPPLPPLQAAAPPPLANIPAVQPIRSPVSDQRFRQIVRNARLVKIGSTIVGINGGITVLVGMCYFGGGILARFGGGDDDQIAREMISWNAIGIGISLMVAGILLIALAAFFRMIAFTCEAHRELVIATMRLRELS